MFEEIFNFISAHYLELITTSLTILWLFFEYRASMWIWPLGILLPVLWITISLEDLVYGNIIINSYYFVTSIIGWIMWTRKKGGEKEMPITSVPKNAIIISVCVGILTSGIGYFLLSNYTDSPFPLVDSVATVLSFMGMIWLSKKWWQHWYCWIPSNMLYYTMFVLQENYISATSFFVSILISTLGIPHWLSMMRKQNEASK